VRTSDRCDVQRLVAGIQDEDVTQLAEESSNGAHEHLLGARASRRDATVQTCATATAA
jgi:hypothetical protein